MLFILKSTIQWKNGNHFNLKSIEIVWIKSIDIECIDRTHTNNKIPLQDELLFTLWHYDNTYIGFANNDLTYNINKCGISYNRVYCKLFCL